jgi:hypothetical protein
MAVWPPSIQRAFAEIYYGGDYEGTIEPFAQHWGGLDVRTFLHVLEVGSVRWLILLTSVIILPILWQ